MRRLVIIIMGILLVGAFMTPSVTAQTSENLEWIVQQDDQYFMHFYVWDDVAGFSFNDDIYINVTSAPGAIPDPLTDVLVIPDPTLGGYYLNDTEMGWETMYLMFIWKMVLPIGNWSLMTTLFENVTEWDVLGTLIPVDSQVYIDNWYSWGYSYNLTSPGEGYQFVNITYSKVDGFLAYYWINAFEIGTNALVGGVELFRDGTPPVVNSPTDIVYNVGNTGNEIVWNATDQSPAGYQILKDDVEVEKGLWNSTSEEITVDVDGLDAGSYNYTVVFYEASGISTSDQVQVDVLDEPVDPTIDHPADVTYVEGETGHTITWNPSDDSPASYQILKDGIQAKSGLWNSSSEAISISVDGLTPGSYNYTIIVTDGDANTATDTVWVIVTEWADIIDPIIDHPADVTYIEGETGNTITWNPSDDLPASYQILKDGIEVKSGLWNSSSEAISISVDGLTPGSYNYTIIVTDDGANTAVDTVWVEVSAPTTTTTTTTTTGTSTTDIPFEMLMIAVGVGGVVIIVIVIIVIKKR